MYSCVKYPITIASSLFAAGVLIAVLLAYASLASSPPNAVMLEANANPARPDLLARNGQPLALSYYSQNGWNPNADLASIPIQLQRTITLAEDKRFWRHGGNDWLARFNAAFQSAQSLRQVRGASTITEQLIRIHRNANGAAAPKSTLSRFWQRWLDGLAAYQLEQQQSKEQILALYIANVPYASARRGAKQAARLYFNRSLETLTTNEFLALSVLPRSPTALDPRFGNRQKQALERRMQWLRQRLNNASNVSNATNASGSITIDRASLDVEASHFARWIYNSQQPSQRSNEMTSTGNTAIKTDQLTTTLDPTLQRRIQATVDTQLAKLATRSVANAAALVIDHQSNQILAWVVGSSADSQSDHINAVLAPRQPGSTLKPFIYAMALERGWTAATLIDDAPLSQRVGLGVHSYRNYSGKFYGKVRLREALANSLNIPAVHALEFAGPTAVLMRLRRAGLHGLTKSADFYGGGLALGAGEVSLFELVSSYATLARNGSYQPSSGLLNQASSIATDAQPAWDHKISRIITDILSDPEARRLEFGDSAMRADFAFKTGTSNGHRDAWTVAYNSQHVIGIWLGNLDGRPMLGVTGGGSALPIVASIASLLPEQKRQARSELIQQRICKTSAALAGKYCPSIVEVFRAGHETSAICPFHLKPSEPLSNSASNESENHHRKVEITAPRPSMVIALDPRIPATLQRYSFKVSHLNNGDRVRWKLNDQVIGTTEQPEFLWTPISGKHKLEAEVLSPTLENGGISALTFLVR